MQWNSWSHSTLSPFLFLLVFTIFGMESNGVDCLHMWGPLRIHQSPDNHAPPTDQPTGIPCMLPTRRHQKFLKALTSAFQFLTTIPYSIPQMLLHLRKKKMAITPAGSLVFFSCSLFMASLFAYSASVQFNDPGIYSLISHSFSWISHTQIP